MNEDRLISESAQRQAQALAKDLAKPKGFTVGATLTYERKWSNGFGLTAYARAWWDDAAVTPTAEVGGRVKF